jgi:hypothetical protein|uniref:RING-type domain-containing protein n=1 Tax=viral metagenome TaxID=1070528 RepID=A0A6C0BRX7_9ZZZZ
MAICKATLKCSMKRGQTPKLCSYRAMNGSDYCGKHCKFAVSSSLPPSPENAECCICMEDITHTIPFTCTPCKHYFHTSCLNRWKSQSNNCPCCRKSLFTGQNQTDSDRLNARMNNIPYFAPFSARQHVLYSH